MQHTPIPAHILQTPSDSELLHIQLQESIAALKAATTDMECFTKDMECLTKDIKSILNIMRQRAKVGL